MKKRLGLIISGSLLVLTACGSEEEASEINIGYFPNLTHITTMIALENGYFEEEFGEDITISTSTFSNGSLFMESMATDEVDIGTVGPSPAMTTFFREPEHEIVAGAVNGGAVLEVRPGAGIESVEDLDGTRVAIPTIGSTQDIMLRQELKEAGLNVEGTENGTVRTVAQAPADTANLFLGEDVEAAATQEPWGINLEDNADAELLLDAEEFAWGEESTNTVVTARNDFTEANPELTEGYLRAHVRAVEFANENPEEAVGIFLSHMEEIGGGELSEDQITRAYDRLFPTYDINEEVLQEMAAIGLEAEYANSDDIEGLVNLDYLNSTLENE